MSNDPFSSKAAEDFLSGGATAAKWPRVGHVVEGTVTKFSMAQQTDYESGELLYWQGNSRVVESEAEDKIRPVMQLLLELQCEPTGETWEGLQNVRKALPDDDGARTAYVKGALQAALKEALRTASAKLEAGAYVRIERTADGPKSNPKFAAPHRYAAVWTPAAQNPKALAEFESDAPTADDNPFAR